MPRARSTAGSQPVQLVVEPARGFIIEQDREIAAKSGRTPLKIRSIARVGAKPKKMMRVG